VKAAGLVYELSGTAEQAVCRSMVFDEAMV